MDKTSENGWMESIVPPFSPPDVDDTNSAIAGAARNCCPALTFKLQGRTLSIFILCKVIESGFSFTWEVGIDGCSLPTRCFQLFLFLRIVKLPFHKIRLPIEEFYYLRILFDELK